MLALTRCALPNSVLLRLGARIICKAALLLAYKKLEEGEGVDLSDVRVARELLKVLAQNQTAAILHGWVVEARGVGTGKGGGKMANRGGPGGGLFVFVRVPPLFIVGPGADFFCFEGVSPFSSYQVLGCWWCICFVSAFLTNFHL